MSTTFTSICFRGCKVNKVTCCILWLSLRSYKVHVFTGGLRTCVCHCSAIKVAHTGQTIEQAVENVVGALSEITRIIPRGWNNIQSLNLKTSDSISLPIYTSLPEKSLAIEDTQPPNKKRKMQT